VFLKYYFFVLLFQATERFKILNAPFGSQYSPQKNAEDEVSHFSVDERLLPDGPSPSLRLSVDIKSIQPGSVQRFHFEELFISDVSSVMRNILRGLKNSGDTVVRKMPTIRVCGIRPAPGMEWLTIVDFDLTYPRNESNSHRDDEQSGTGSFQGGEMSSQRLDLLELFFELVKDPISTVYNGKVTCNVDPSYIGFTRKEEYVREV
jgi:hypothetical protein